MNYLMEAVSNPRKTVTRLKTKGWSIEAIKQFYPSFSDYVVIRSPKERRSPTDVEIKRVSIDDKQILKLYDIVKGGADIDELSKRLEVPMDMCEDFGSAITMVMRMISRDVQREQYRKMVLLCSNRMQFSDIADASGVPYNYVRKFIKDVYDARPNDVRGF